MKQSIKILTYALFVFTFIITNCYSDAWVQNKQKGMIITSIEGKTFKGINDNGTFDSKKNINHTIFSLYGEYGLTNRTTIGGKILAIDAMQMQNNKIIGKVDNRSFALDTAQLFTRIKIIQNDIFVLSFATILGSPSIYKKNDYLSPYFSIQKWNYEPRLEFGLNINSSNFLTFTTGYHRNINHWYDEIRMELTYGFYIENVLFMLKLQKYVFITTDKEKSQQLAENNRNISIYDVFIQSGFAKLNASFVVPVENNVKLEFGFYASLQTKILFTENLKLNLYGIYASVWYNF